jgi:hypothetical protein
MPALLYFQQYDEKQTTNKDACWDGNNSIVDALLMSMITIILAIDRTRITRLMLEDMYLTRHNQIASYRVEAI